MSNIINKDRIVIQEDDENIVHFIESKLLESLHEALPQSLNTGFVLSARDNTEESKILGGITASTSYSWLLIKILWVDITERNSGIGRSLMKEAEQKGKALGCHSAWLDTSNPDAMNFYLTLGYKVFGELSNDDNQNPPTHKRWFMKKTL
ncbi:GNAT family N-acetyltransferase [Marinomonas sp. 2405UD68-3]|uniref:GNAT family N-acetyltransferase n=1 Tax=Marinomonas sp. 2405UD68-3 TaxID=3391835 RepID=UPI0039C90D99